MSRLVACVLIYTPNRVKQITRKNIELAYSDLHPIEHKLLVAASLKNLAIKIFDLMYTWFATEESIQKRVKEVRGLEEFRSARDFGPTLILLPHLGNWEIFGLWLSLQFPYTAMFRPFRVPALTQLIRRAREKGGNHLVEANPAGIRHLLVDLQRGGLGILLPDQSPKTGQGEYIPFFDVQTLTPTLPFRLAQSTGAVVFVAAAVRQGREYHIDIKRLNADLSDRITWLTQMNQLIETFVREHPEQYQWEYRRFRNAPDGTLRYP